jgi:hypothetical protein
MTSRALPIAAALALIAVAGGASGASERLPTIPGTCVLATIASVETRLMDGSKPIRGSGSAVVFANKGYQVSYEEIPEISASRRGDRVYMCLMQIPRGCPPGDNRGCIYTTTNLRTMQSWTLPDAEHMCGGRLTDRQLRFNIY